MKIGKQHRGGSIKIHTNFSSKLSKISRIVLIIVIIAGFIWSQNNLLIVKNDIFESSRIPKSFVGTKIVHISDLYNETLGAYNKVIKQNPDIVIVSGNLSNSSGKYNNSVELINNLSKHYRTYYVLGESDKDIAQSIYNSIDSAICLENNRVSINAKQIDFDTFVNEYIGKVWVDRANKGNESAQEYLDYTREALNKTVNSVIEISGLPILSDNDNLIDKAYSVLNYDKNIFQILVMNQSQKANGISQADVDVILTGNTCGMYRQDNGCKSGLYSNNSTSIIVSNGIGKPDDAGSRIFNWPSIQVITLSDGTLDTGNPLERLLGKYIYDVETRFDNDGGFERREYNYGTYEN